MLTNTLSPSEQMELLDQTTPILLTPALYMYLQNILAIVSSLVYSVSCDLSLT